MENNEQRKELKVSAIENGTVIDHIPANSLFKVIRILSLENLEEQVLFGTNLESKKYGRKGIVKVSNKFFESDEVNKIALVAPHASLIEIRDYKVVHKSVVEIPDHIEKIVRCFNPNCITNHEQVTTSFDVFNDEGMLKLRCHYCEKTTLRESAVFI